ncbi:unnamed protein product [Nezara viridula]|uniref:Neuropeptide n=1 Tax=Nezara viridula TaxID=85310 RepID=A0A9P0MJ02_NEZVI|nr:unnamed protein product [Nezara viridula]
MKRLVVALCLVAACSAFDISVLGLFELNGTSQSAELAAAQLAVQHVNGARVLGQHRLKLVVNDTKSLEGDLHPHSSKLPLQQEALPPLE